VKQTIKNYSFNKAAKTVTFTDFGSISLDRIYLITNVTSNVLIYQFNNNALGGTVSTNVLTLTFDTSTMNNTDKLQIIYDSATGDPTYDVQPISGTITTTPSGTQTVSGTVSAHVQDNSGNGITSTANALDVNIKSGGSSGTVAQGSTTAGEAGNLVQGAVTTSAPTYTTGQTNPLSLTTAGALRVDASTSTQPVSGTVAATQSGTWTIQPGNTANTTPWLITGGLTHNNAAPSASNVGVIPAIANATTPTYTEGDQVLLSTDLKTNLRTTIEFPGTSVGINGLVDNADAVGVSGVAKNLQVINRNTVFNGTTWDRQYGDATNGTWVNVKNTSIPVTQTTGTNLHTVVDSGAVTATLNAETTKVIGVARTADGSGNLLTSTSNALDVNIKSGGSTSTQITDGTNTANILKSDGTAAGQNAILTAGSYIEKASLSTASTTNNDLQPSIDVSGYKYGSIQATGSWTGTVTVQGSNDNVNFQTVTIDFLGNVNQGPLSNFTNNNIYTFEIKARYLRVRVTTGGTGTVTGVLELYTNSLQRNTNVSAAIQSGTWTVQPGNTPNSTPWLINTSSATAASVPGNAFYAGLQAKTVNPTAASDGNLVGALSDKLGKQVVVGSIRDLKSNQQTTITSSTAETTIITADATNFLDLYGLVIANTSATACAVTIKDSTAGTTRFVFGVPANDTRGFMLSESAAHKQAANNSNWTATCGTSVASISITAMFVKNL